MVLTVVAKLWWSSEIIGYKWDQYDVVLGMNLEYGRWHSIDADYIEGTLCDSYKQGWYHTRDYYSSYTPDLELIGSVTRFNFIDINKVSGIYYGASPDENNTYITVNANKGISNKVYEFEFSGTRCAYRSIIATKTYSRGAYKTERINVARDHYPDNDVYDDDWDTGENGWYVYKGPAYG